MNIIIEGPDGAGKSTLAKAFESLGWTLAPKACTSEGGALGHSDLMRWLHASMSCDGYVIDRHPVLSGYVYDYVLGRETPLRWPADYLNAMRRKSIIIYCRPPSPVILDAASRAPQMEGVLRNLWRIIDEYDRLFRLIPAIHYDWTHDDLPSL